MVAASAVGTGASLDGDGRRSETALLETSGDLRSHAIEKAVNFFEVPDVLAKGSLGAQALALSMCVDRSIVDTADAFPQHPPPTAETSHQTVDREFTQLRDRRDAHLVQRPFRRRADSVEPAHRQRCEESLHLLRPYDRQPVGFVEIGGDLGHQLVGGDADADRQAALLPNPATDVLRQRRCTAEFAEVLADIEEGLIERKRLDDRGVSTVDVEDQL
jgi:hypothetical protein